jgi:hypothetical protein
MQPLQLLGLNLRVVAFRSATFTFLLQALLVAMPTPAPKISSGLFTVNPDDAKMLALVALRYTSPDHTVLISGRMPELLEIWTRKWCRLLDTHDIKAQLLKGMSDVL